MTTFSIAALFLAGGLTGQAPAPPESSGWKTVRVDNGAMTIRFPAPPEIKSKPVPGLEGPIQHTTYYLQNVGCLYSVQHFRYPKVVAKAKVAEQLAAEKLAQTLGQEPTREKNLKLDGMEGGEFQVKRPAPLKNGTVTTWTRHFLKGDNYYTITVMSPPDKPLPPDAERFQDSIHCGHPAAKARPSMKGRPGITAEGEAAAGPLPAADTPEAALRSCMLAMITHDEPALKALTLPVPDSDLAWLLKGEAVPAGEIEQARAFFSTMKIRTLQPGDRVELEGGRTITVRPSEVDDSHAVLMSEGAPLPTRVQKLRSRWRVDARPIIAGRKAADAARKKKDGGR